MKDKYIEENVLIINQEEEDVLETHYLEEDVYDNNDSEEDVLETYVDRDFI